MVIQRIIQKHTQLLTMTGGGNCDLLLSELADYAIKQGLAKPGFTESLLEREQNFPTGIQAASGTVSYTHLLSFLFSFSQSCPKTRNL